MRRSPEIPRDIFFGEDEAHDVKTERASAELKPVEEPKVQVTVYLAESTAKRLEALRFHLLNEYNIKVSKSAIADFAISRLGTDLGPLAEHFSVMGER